VVEEKETVVETENKVVTAERLWVTGPYFLRASTSREKRRQYPVINASQDPSSDLFPVHQTQKETRTHISKPGDNDREKKDKRQKKKVVKLKRV
jgi:hypothetical protein